MKMIQKRELRICLITQDDIFYLPQCLDYFIRRLNIVHTIPLCIVTSASPYGKREKFAKKCINTFRIFGVKFFIRYALKFLWKKCTGSTITGTMNKNKIPTKKVENINTETVLKLLRRNKIDLAISVASNQIFKKDP